MDSAVVRFPAIGFLPFAWNLLLWRATTTFCITSGRNGAAKTEGRLIFSDDLPLVS